MGRILLGALGGFFGGALIALGLCVAAAWLFDISQAEGAYAMGVAFFYMPVGGILGAIAGSMLAGGRKKAGGT